MDTWTSYIESKRSSKTLKIWLRIGGWWFQNYALHITAVWILLFQFTYYYCSSSPATTEFSCCCFRKFASCS